MSPIPRTVLVLGAGFTKAFAPNAPGLIGDFGGEDLAKKFRRFRRAARILDAEMVGRGGPEMDIERLMTRLDGRMPYDREHEAESELAGLLTDLKKNFIERVRGARDETFHKDDLALVAECCVENSINCVTFNYDDVFDQALCEARPAHGGTHWSPMWGYGFFCRSSYALVDEAQVANVLSPMRLIKLHGSVNWRTKLGSPKPYGLDAVVHDESWYSPLVVDRSLVPYIDDHLDPEPFIVPPVLVKSSLVEEPVLQKMWSVAYEELDKAERVIFVGYSFPVTDLAARFLFSETLLGSQRPEIKVVNAEGQEDAVRQAYRTVFPEIADEHFDFRGARNWSREFVAEVSGDRTASG